MPGGLGTLGRWLLVLGGLLMVVDLVFLVADRFPGLRIGRLPGDLTIERGRFRFYFPLATSIVLLTALLWLIGRR